MFKRALKFKRAFSEEPVSFERLKASALRMLSRRDHSLSELRAKLKSRYKFLDADFEKLVLYLRNYNYLVDEKILARRLCDAWRGEGRGRFWIEAKLKQKGLPVGVVAETAISIDGSADPLPSGVDGKAAEFPAGPGEQAADESIDRELEAAKLFLAKKLRGRDVSQIKMTFAERVKLSRKLQARGFSRETISRALAETI